jgi:hypothetical protein
MTNNIRDARTFVALQFELAANEADMMEPSADMKRRMAALGASIRRREAQRRYEENALWPVKVASAGIRPEILSMQRAEVVAQLNSLKAEHPRLQYNHRDAETLSDDDLRGALEDALTLIEAGK